MDNSNSDQSRRFAGEIPIPWGIMDFYSRDQDPWHPPGIITPLQKQSGSGGFQSTGPSFQGFRSTHQPSESDLNDDSGYGGSNRPPYSIENTSVYGDDRNPEAQLAAHRIETLQIHTDASRENQLQQWSQPRRTANLTAVPGSRDNQHCCSECNVSFRTRSEYKKHMLRHRKPFTCDAPNCARRKEGFGTKNDLDRHKRSVHSDLSVSGPRYVCRMGQCGSKEPVKIWPRADNFRSHLHRVHKVEIKAEDDLEPYIYHQLQDQVPLRQELQGVGGSVLGPEPGSLNYQLSGALAFDQPFPGPQLLGARPRNGFSDIQEALSSLPRTANDGTSGLAPVQEDEEVYIEPGILNGAGPHSTQSSPALGDDLLSLPQISHQPPSPNNEDALHAGEASMEQNESELSIPAASSQGVDEPQIDDHGSDCSPDSDSDSDSSEPDSPDAGMANANEPDSTSSSISGPLALLSGLKEDDPKVLEFLRALPKEVLESVLKSDSSGSSSDGSQTKPSKSRIQHICSVCSKPFNRPCELKKHKKRHEKPYGCTFINCHKIFGSKNDWKRHESSQHWHLETWACDCKKADGQPCEKRFMRRESFKHHLQRDHSLDDSGMIDNKLETCRIGRHCESRYWCGFCERIIEVGGEKVNAWAVRWNHIDDHFCGRNGQEQKNIKQWVYPVQPEEQHDDSNAQDRSPTRAAPAKRSRGTAEQTARKRRREAATYMWSCCRCNSVYNLKLVAQCLECSHEKCDAYCDVQMVMPENKAIL